MHSHKIRDVVRFSILFAAFSTIVVPGLDAQGLPATADAQVSSSFATTNFGSLPFLQVGGPSQAYIQFDTSSFAGITAPSVLRATLTLWVSRLGTAGAVDVAAASGPWTESGITSANAPAALGVIGSVPVAQASEFVTVDITSQVKSWLVSPGSNYGLVVVASSTAPSTVVFFDSKESVSTSHAPELEIVLSPTAGAPGPQGPQGPAGITGASGAAGPIGLAGAAGTSFNWRQAYAAGTTYAIDDAVLFNGSAYVSLQNSNTGNTPDASPAFWSVVASVGAAGPQGSTGPTGPQGGPVRADRSNRSDRTSGGLLAKRV